MRYSGRVVLRCIGPSLGGGDRELLFGMRSMTILVVTRHRPCRVSVLAHRRLGWLRFKLGSLERL